MNDNQDVRNYFLPKERRLDMEEIWKLEYNGRLAQIFRDNGKHKFFLDNIKQVEYDEINGVLLSDNGERYALEVRNNGKEFICLDGIEYPAYKAVGYMEFSSDGKHFAYRAMKDNGKCCVVIDGKEGREYDDVSNIRYSSAGTLAYCASVSGLWCMVLDGEEESLYGWVGPCVFGPKSHYAYAVKKNDKWGIIVDGMDIGWSDNKILTIHFSVGLHVDYLCAKDGGYYSVKKDVADMYRCTDLGPL